MLGIFRQTIPKNSLVLLAWVNVYLNVNTCLLGEILSFLNSSCFFALFRFLQMSMQSEKQLFTF